MTWLIGLGVWCLLAILLAFIYSAIRTCEKKREERAANHQGSITL